MPRSRQRFVVRRQPQSKSWGVFDRSGRLIEGGFFDRDYAVDACQAHNYEWNQYCLAQPDTPSLHDVMAFER